MGKMEVIVFYNLMSKWHVTPSFFMLLVTEPNTGTVWGGLHSHVNTEW